MFWSEFWSGAGRAASGVLTTVLCSLALAFPLGAAAAERTSTLPIVVLDAASGLPIEGADVRVLNADRELAEGVSDVRGRVVLTVKPGPDASKGRARQRELRVQVTHFLYLSTSVPTSVRFADAAEQAALEIRLEPAEVFEVVAVAHASAFRPAATLRGLELQESLRGNVPETIADLPGVAVAYNGPGAARPTIRGLGGDRVLVLEDGFRTGDLYWSASDHGVMVEPLTAQQVEVVRGPATLVYGVNALGGVVNVVRNDIPQWPRAATEATLGTQLDSASQGAAVGGTVVAPAGPLTLRLEGSTRGSGDVRTPSGRIPNTGVDALSGSAGAAWHPSWGWAGASLRYYASDYGVPGEFGGQLVPGGHPGGAGIEARRFSGLFQASYTPELFPSIESIEAGASLRRYLHDEVEGVIDGRRALGAAFELDTLQANLRVRHAVPGAAGWRMGGTVGTALSAQNLEAGGNSPGVRSGRDRSVAVFAFEQLELGALAFQAGARYERRNLVPRIQEPIAVRTAERVIEKSVTERGFHLLSGSVAVLWEFGDGWTLGSTVARSERAPNLQELYSDGPHLADFSFDIGTPSLPAEVGTGLDVFLLAELEPFSLELTGFVNAVDDFVQYAPTLETVRVFREGSRPRDTPVFEARNVDASFLGAEGTLALRAGAGLSVESTLSYVRAERRDNGDPLPFIPPLHGKVALRYEHGGFFASVGLSGAARQARVPRAVEIGQSLELPQNPTSGYALGHASAGWTGELLGARHAMTARAFNVADSNWRDHLSRIKDVAPQMGRNVSLTYQVQYQ